MSNNNYWAKRYEELMNRQMKKAEVKDEELRRIYNNTMHKVENTINGWYERYARKNYISLAEARKQISAQEREELRWTVDEYIRQGSAENLTDEIKKQLENASIQYHISRLEALQVQTIMHLNELYTREEDIMNVLMGDIYTNSYYHSIYENERVKKHLNAFNVLPKKAIEKVLNKPYTTDGLNFSARVWKNRDKLIKDVQSTILKSLIRGRNSDREARELSKKVYDNMADNDEVISIREKLKSARRASRRLILTEASFFCNQGIADSCEELGAEQYQLLATLDGRTSPTCQDMDLQIFKLDERAVGVNYPPFHPYCRTVAKPFDQFKHESDTRIARGKDGKVHYVPHDLSYKEWYNKYMKEEPAEAETKGEEQPTKEVNKKGVANIKRTNGEIVKICEKQKIKHNPITERWSEPPTTGTLVHYIGGGDETGGSCASVALAWIANRNNYKVLDFRGGRSRNVFSTGSILEEIAKLDGVLSNIKETNTPQAECWRMFEALKANREYALIVGRHMAIIRKTVAGEMEFLELQSNALNGFKPLRRTKHDNTLKWRFNAPKRSKYVRKVRLIDIETLGENKEFLDIVGYINTNEGEEQKGAKGYEK